MGMLSIDLSICMNHWIFFFQSSLGYNVHSFCKMLVKKESLGLSNAPMITFGHHLIFLIIFTAKSKESRFWASTGCNLYLLFNTSFICRWIYSALIRKKSSTETSSSCISAWKTNLGNCIRFDKTFCFLSHETKLLLKIIQCLYCICFWFQFEHLIQPIIVI